METCFRRTNVEVVGVGHCLKYYLGMIYDLIWKSRIVQGMMFFTNAFLIFHLKVLVHAYIIIIVYAQVCGTPKCLKIDRQTIFGDDFYTRPT